MEARFSRGDLAVASSSIAFRLLRRGTPSHHRRRTAFPGYVDLGGRTASSADRCEHPPEVRSHKYPCRRNPDSRESESGMRHCSDIGCITLRAISHRRFGLRFRPGADCRDLETHALASSVRIGLCSWHGAVGAARLSCVQPTSRSSDVRPLSHSVRRAEQEGSLPGAIPVVGESEEARDRTGIRGQSARGAIDFHP